MVAQVIRPGAKPNSITIEDFKPHEAIERQQAEIDRLRAECQRAQLECSEIVVQRDRLRAVNAELVATLKEILVGAEMEQCENFSQAVSNRKIIAKIARAALARAKGKK